MQAQQKEIEEKLHELESSPPRYAIIIRHVQFQRL